MAMETIDEYKSRLIQEVGADVLVKAGVLLEDGRVRTYNPHRKARVTKYMLLHAWVSAHLLCVTDSLEKILQRNPYTDEGQRNAWRILVVAIIDARFKTD